MNAAGPAGSENHFGENKPVFTRGSNCLLAAAEIKVIRGIQGAKELITSVFVLCSSMNPRERCVEVFMYGYALRKCK